MYNLSNQCRIVADISAYKEGVEVGQVRQKEQMLATLFRSVQIHHHARHVNIAQQNGLKAILICYPVNTHKYYRLALKIQSHVDKITQTNGYASYLKYHLANQIATLEYATTQILNFPELSALKDIICGFFRQTFLTAPYIVCPLMWELLNTQIVRDIYLTQFTQTHQIQIINFGHQFNMNYQQYQFYLYDDDYGCPSSNSVYSQYGQSTAYNPYSSSGQQGMTDSQYQQYTSTQNPYANQSNQQQAYQYPQQPPQAQNTQPYTVPQPPQAYQQSQQQVQQQITANYAPMPSSQYQYPQNEQAKSYQPNYNYPPPNPPPPNIPNPSPETQYYNQQQVVNNSNYQQPVATAPNVSNNPNYNDNMVALSQASTQSDQLTKMTDSINYGQHGSNIAPTQPQYNSQTGYPQQEYKSQQSQTPQQYNVASSQGQLYPSNPTQLPPPPPPPPPPQIIPQIPYQPTIQQTIPPPVVQEPSRDDESLFEALLLNENLVKPQLRDSTGQPTLVSAKAGFRKDKITKGFKNHDEQSLYILKCYIDGKYAQTKIDRTQEMKDLVSS